MRTHKRMTASLRGYSRAQVVKTPSLISRIYHSLISAWSILPKTSGNSTSSPILGSTLGWKAFKTKRQRMWLYLKPRTDLVRASRKIAGMR